MPSHSYKGLRVSHFAEWEITWKYLGSGELDGPCLKGLPKSRYLVC